MSDKNLTQRLTTDGGYVIEIDEEKKRITISIGSGKQKIILDENNNTVSLEAGSSLNIKAGSISIEADNTLTLKGKQIKIDGSTTKIIGQSAELTGSNVKVESSGILTLKGSVTKIN